jgi:RHS repeat-associated protein
MNAGTARTWNYENQLTSITVGGVTTTNVYDGDGNRVKRTVGSTTTIYINQYYEKTGTEVTTHYYLGGKEIALRKGSTLSYVYQDSLGSTSVTSDSSGGNVSKISYLAYGQTRGTSGPALPTDKKFTGQRLDSDGLYYYGARYYDPSIGRFISADTIVPNPANPQSLNRYSYCINNPLKYIDPTGMRFSSYYSWSIYSNYDPVEDAYQQVINDSNVSTWIKDYMIELHDSDRNIRVEFGDFGGNAVGLSAMEWYTFGQGGNLIHLGTDEDYIGIDTRLQSNLAPILAHECYHIYEGNPGSTIEEEYTAYTAEYFVKKSFPDTWFNIPGALGSDKFLKGIKEQLTKGQGHLQDVYRTMPLRQSHMNQAILAKQALITAQYVDPGWKATIFSYLAPGMLYVRGIPWK